MTEAALADTFATIDLRLLHRDALAVRGSTPTRTPADPEQRLDNAIGELQSRGIPVDGYRSLIRYLADCLEAVQQNSGGYDLSSYQFPDGTQARFPSGGTRLFYGGSVADPADSTNPDGVVSSRAVVELATKALHRKGIAATTLEGLGDAATIDRLNLWDRNLDDFLEEPLAAAMADRPRLAAQIRDDNGNPSLKKFAALVWKEGLSTQYAREADGPVGVINTAPFERQTWFENERPAALANGHTTREDITYAGFTHAPLTAAQFAQGQKSQPLPTFTGPLNDRAANAYITFPSPPTPAPQKLETHPNLEALYQRAVRTRNESYASTPTIKRKPTQPHRTHPQYPPTRPTR